MQTPLATPLAGQGFFQGAPAAVKVMYEWRAEKNATQVRAPLTEWWQACPSTWAVADGQTLRVRVQLRSACSP